MSGTGASLNDKIDLAPWGYAPGDHPISCNDCVKECSDDSLHFLHRHATRCVKHALAARQVEIRAHEMDPIDGIVDPEEIVAEMIVEAFDDSCARILFIGAIFIAIAGVVSLFYWF